MYVSLEAMCSTWRHLYQSPEWSIATIFLSFVGNSIYRKEAEKTGIPIRHEWFGIMWLLTLIIIGVALFNAYFTMCNAHEKTEPDTLLLSIRIVLFVIASVVFFIKVTGSKFLHQN